jgi:hypothetical protein
MLNRASCCSSGGEVDRVVVETPAANDGEGACEPEP